MELFIYNGLMKIAEKNSVNFHTPGHKNNVFNMDWLKDIASIDYTESFGGDNLLNPEGMIKESLNEIAKIFGANQSLFSLNGSTGAVYMAQNMALNPGETLLVQRDSHKSIYSGAILNQIKLDYVYPKYNQKKHIVIDIGYDEIEKKLKENKNIKGVMLVYPNYYGITSDLKNIAELIHSYGALLIVDEAHGSHMHFSEDLPPSSLECGADIVIQSTHKTLPSLTQTSLIHISERVDKERLYRAHELFQTTSPSYIYMTSIENAVAYMDSNKGRKRLAEILEYISEFRDKVLELPRIQILQEKDLNFSHDKMRILIGHEALTGSEFRNILYKDYNINLEMSDFYYGLALSTINNTKKDFEKYYEALLDLSKRFINTKAIDDINMDIIRGKEGIPIYEAYCKDKIKIPFKKAVGKISGQQITPYPPGVPMVLPGEIITEEIINKLLKLIEEKVDIVGLSGDNNMVEIIK